jgi:hypothetical protein
VSTTPPIPETPEGLAEYLSTWTGAAAIVLQDLIKQCGHEPLAYRLWGEALDLRAAQIAVASDIVRRRSNLAAALRQLKIRLGPNSLAMAQRGEPIILNMGEAEELAMAIDALRDDELQRMRERLAYLEGYNEREVARRKTWHGRAETAEARVTAVQRWIDGEPVTSGGPLGDGYREALRDITDVLTLRTKPTTRRAPEHCRDQ